jgi:DNA polymerase-1
VQVLDSGKHTHEQLELAEMHLALRPPPLRELAEEDASQRGEPLKKRGRIALDEVNPAAALGFTAAQADITLRLHAVLEQRLGSEGMRGVYEEMERPLLHVLARMERRGVYVDQGHLERLSDSLYAKCESLEGDIFKIAGREFNINSAQQLGAVLFDELRIPNPGTKSKKGGVSTSAEVLDQLYKDGSAPIPRPRSRLRPRARARARARGCAERAGLR